MLTENVDVHYGVVENGEVIQNNTAVSLSRGHSEHNRGTSIDVVGDLGIEEETRTRSGDSTSHGILYYKQQNKPSESESSMTGSANTVELTMENCPNVQRVEIVGTNANDIDRHRTQGADRNGRPEEVLVISADTKEREEGDELTAADHNSTKQRVEMGVAADKFWDSVNSRAQVLAVPNSFKTGSKKTFRQF